MKNRSSCYSFSDCTRRLRCLEKASKASGFVGEHVGRVVVGVDMDRENEPVFVQITKEVISYIDMLCSFV